MLKNNKKSEQPTIASGIDNDEELEQKATNEEINNDEYTQVTTLTLDDFGD